MIHIRLEPEIFTLYTILAKLPPLSACYNKNRYIKSNTHHINVCKKNSKESKDLHLMNKSASITCYRVAL